ncbi:MAG: DUF1269 domain-containing protein [Chromatiales bacterium]|jgi:hypothetical protein
MRRLNVILPDVDHCKAVVAELREAGIPEEHMHVVANIAQPVEGLPEATVWERTELAHGIELGLGLGGAAGLLGGVLAVVFPPAGLVLGGGAVLASAAAGAGVGGVVSALLGSHEHNHDLDAFAQAIEAGRLLLMVDVPRRAVDSTRTLILMHHPEAEIGVARPKT